MSDERPTYPLTIDLRDKIVAVLRRSQTRIAELETSNASLAAGVKRNRLAEAKPRSKSGIVVSNITGLRSIETKYKGYRFRSRLEARWAVFFDAMGAPWEYEPEGYTMPSGRCYLPDFRLIKMDLLLDIKPALADTDVRSPSIPEGTKEYEFCEWLSQEKDAPRFGVIYGRPGRADPSEESNSYGAVVGFDMTYLFCTCPHCGVLGLEFDGRGARVCKSKTGCQAAKKSTDDKGYTYHDKRMLRAFEKARAARFEHGESPGFL